MIQGGRLSDAALRDTLDMVFAGPEFTHVARETILSRILNWVGGLLRELMQITGGSRLLYYTVLLLAIALIVAVVARVAYIAYSRGAFGPRGGRVLAGATGGSAEDPWTLAQRLAAEGDYTAAAHALYGAVLQSASRDGLVRLHHAKTIGDYLRELRARASSTILQTFREFARGYEYVVYGVGECDRARYERLFGLATRLMSHG
ncbi:MAG TPA: DUF4129 domain-containing protein [Gemmatimonadaceae bacterium]|nr:DUF4129 domain-containing protein [Gemmatimonadaceae bacterium]